MEEKQVEEEKKETPKGYYVTEVPTSTARVVALGEEVVEAEELLVKVANAVQKAGLM